MVQVPALASVTVALATVQVEEVVDAKLTAAPDEAVALTVNGAVPNALSARAANVMVWIPGATVKPWLTAGAAAKLLLPACEARIVHVPAPASVTVVPDTVQTGIVVEVKATARPEVAVAAMGNGAPPNVWLANAAKGCSESAR
jgi:hypothetical protein